MTNKTGVTAPATGYFRPESASHFKEVAKNMAWLLERPLQRCQEDLSRIYGYSGLHELQQVLGRPGLSGPFDSRYNYLEESASKGLIQAHEQRIFFIIFGVRKDYWQESKIAEPRCFLIFEMGLFQEAAEHRACFKKIKQVLTSDMEARSWPLIHGFPLGLKSWLASNYTQPCDMSDGWRDALPESEFARWSNADVRLQQRRAGLARFESMFQLLAPRVGGTMPVEMADVAFDDCREESEGFMNLYEEAYCLEEWLMEKMPKKNKAVTEQQRKLIRDFIDRPSKATASKCEFVKDLADPIEFRDRWAFETFKAAQDPELESTKAVFESTLRDELIHSLFLDMDFDSASISATYGCQLWEFQHTQTKQIASSNVAQRPKLQPAIHAKGSLIVPFNSEHKIMSTRAFFFCHDDSSFATENACVALENIYLPAIGASKFPEISYSMFRESNDRPGYRDGGYSIVEIEEILLASTVTDQDLRKFFQELIGVFAGDILADSLGYWASPLSLTEQDEEDNYDSDARDQYADYINKPLVLLINVRECGMTLVNAVHENGGKVTTSTRGSRKKSKPEREKLAMRVREAANGLDVDIVIYDSDM